MAEFNLDFFCWQNFLLAAWAAGLRFKLSNSKKLEQIEIDLEALRKIWAELPGDSTEAKKANLKRYPRYNEPRRRRSWGWR